MKTSTLVLLLVLAVLFAVCVADDKATAAPAPTPASAKPEADKKKKEDEEDATVKDIIAEYNKNTNKADLFIRQITLDKAEDVQALISFLASEQNQAQRVVLSNVYELKEEHLVSILRDGVSKSKNLNVLGLAKVKLTLTACSALANVIAGASSLDKVHLYRSNVNAACVKDIVENGLKKNKSVTKFVSIENNLGDEGFKTIADFVSAEGSNIKELLVRDAGLTAASAKVAGELLEKSKSLTHVDISENPKLSANFAEVVKGLEKSATITHFEFNYGELKKEHVATLVELLKKNKVINRVDISENELGNAGAEELAKALADASAGISLKRLDLSSCEIEDEGAIKIIDAIVANPKAVGVLHFFRNELANNATQQALEKHGDVIKSEFMSEKHIAELEEEEKKNSELADLETDIEEKFIEDDASEVEADEEDEEIAAEEDEDADASEDDEEVQDAAAIDDAEEENLEQHGFLGKQPAAQQRTEL